MNGFKLPMTRLGGTSAPARRAWSSWTVRAIAIANGSHSDTLALCTGCGDGGIWVQGQANGGFWVHESVEGLDVTFRSVTTGQLLDLREPQLGQRVQAQPAPPEVTVTAVTAPLDPPTAYVPAGAPPAAHVPPAKLRVPPVPGHPLPPDTTVTLETCPPAARV